tara:strand:- start:1118 stop:1693 length:576 start_codon:yes stop_codon:yes gene_type:complete
MILNHLGSEKEKIIVDKSNVGMTLIEVQFSLAMFAMFMAVFVAMTEFTSKFINKSEISFAGSEGLLIDNQRLQSIMDGLANTLSQPAFSVKEINEITQSENKKCSYDPMLTWNIPGKSIQMPSGYRICLRTTSLGEPLDETDSQGGITRSSIEKLIDGENPGIYILQALPEEITSSTLPSRRIFCRPKPFC